MPIKGTERVRKGRYRLVGITHTAPLYSGGPTCGGEVYADYFGPELDGDEVLPASWECFCERCLKCDANGWPTLRECVEAAPAYWMGAAD